MEQNGMPMAASRYDYFKVCFRMNGWLVVVGVYTVGVVACGLYHPAWIWRLQKAAEVLRNEGARGGLLVVYP